MNIEIRFQCIFDDNSLNNWYLILSDDSSEEYLIESVLKWLEKNYSRKLNKLIIKKISNRNDKMSFLKDNCFHTYSFDNNSKEDDVKWWTRFRDNYVNSS